MIHRATLTPLTCEDRLSGAAVLVWPAKHIYGMYRTIDGRRQQLMPDRSPTPAGGVSGDPSVEHEQVPHNALRSSRRLRQW